MTPWNRLSSGQRAKISIDSSSLDCSIQDTVPGGGPVGSPRPAKRLTKKAEIWTDGYGGGMYWSLWGEIVVLWGNWLIRISR